MPTEDQLQDLRRRVLEHDKAVAAGEADPTKPPYTVEELQQAIAAISNDQVNLANQTKPKAKAKAKSVDLSDLL